MAEMMSYAQPLRAIGQALEKLSVDSFDMETDGNDFLIKGIAKVTDPGCEVQPNQAGKLRHIWDLLQRRTQVEMKGVVPSRPRGITTKIDLRYTPKDVDRLEREGQAKRVDPEGKADATSLSQILRTVGGYVNLKRARLLKISRSQDAVKLEYETAAGEKIEEALGVSNLYEVWVRMYMKRATRGDQ